MTDYSIDIIKDTSYTIELNEQGPQGIQGERGIQGPEGPIGPKGDKGDVGEKGDTGVSVVGVEEISKVGLVATYRMTFSNGEYFDYQVTDGSIDGLTREVIINIIGYEPASYTSVEGLTTRVSTLEERVEYLTASKFPNVVIVGAPHIEGGQVSNFSNTDYLQFPFVDISRGLPFDIYFSFTTGSDVVNQQNILDSHFGIALAIQNSKGVMALSSNGTSWDIGNITGTNTILPNTTYYAKCSWTGTQYNTSLSTNDTTYTPDMVLDSTLTTNKTTIFIGGSPNLFGEGTAHPFKGTINFNNSRVDVQGVTVWEGMADVGLASRANVSLNNLDEVGEKRFTDIQIALDGKQDKGKTGSGLEICDIGMTLYVDESKGLRRYLNGQIVDINTNTQVFFDRLKQITTLHPSLLCTEEEWQTAKTMSAFGQVGKFVFNYSGDEIVSVRLPRVVNVQGLFDLQNLGMTVAERLPNITASFSSVDLDASGAISNSGQRGSVGGGNTIYTYTKNFNASLSSSTYQDNAPVQQEAIQYPYFIQIATGSETENNIVNDIELNNPHSLFDSKYSDHELNNLSWLKSSGQWNSKAVYPTAYDELLREYNNPDRLATFNKDAFTVVGSPTITDDGVASGFSVANYIKSNSDIVFTAGQTWEIDLKVNIKNSESGIDKLQCLFQIYANNPKLNSLQAVLYNNRVFWTCPTTPSEAAANRFLQFTSEFNISSYLNQNIWFKFIYNGTQYIFEWSADGINFTREVASTDSRQFTGTGTLNLGAMSIHKQGLQGSMDLKGTKITVDGVKVFSGAKSKVKLSTETYTDYDFVLNTAEETFRLPLLDGSEDLIGSGVVNYAVPTKDEQTYIATYNGQAQLEATTTAVNQFIRITNVTTGEKSEMRPPMGGVSSIVSIWVNRGDTFKVNGDVVTTIYSVQLFKAVGNGSLYYYVGETVQNANLIDAGRIGEQLAGKVDVSNTKWATNVCMPDYSAGITGTVAADTTVQVTVDSFVVAYGLDPYMTNSTAYVSPTSDFTSKYIVGRAFDDTNGNTEGYSITFLCPKGWYFRWNVEQGMSYWIYPLKGAK